MPNSFEPTESKGLLVGRDVEIDLFRQVIDGERREWIVHIPGPGGVGKTRLLERMRDDAREQERLLLTAELVDFYSTNNQTGFGLLHHIARQLGPDQFGTFEAERHQFQRFLDTEPDPGERQDAANRVTEAFFRDYQAVLRQELRVLLLFDTCEEMRGVENWVMNTLLPGIEQAEQQVQADNGEDESGTGTAEHGHQTTVVMAGRKPLSFPSSLAGQVLWIELAPLTPNEVQQFFRRGGMGAEEVGDEALAQLHDLSGGRPLYVALSFDWLRNEVGTVEELLALEQPFGEKLVGWVLRLNTPETRTVLYAALAWRRMEASLLARLLEQEEEEAQRLLAKLARFSFVKYRPPTDGFRFQLHDEMRDLILWYVWEHEGWMTRRAILNQIVAWYDDQPHVQNVLEGVERPYDDETRSLVAEWLFYQCRLDLNKGFEIHERLFRRASHHLDLAFCDLLNQEMQRVNEKTPFSERQQDELRFREALVAFRRERYEMAGNIWYSLVRQPDLNEKTRATSLMLLVELEGYTGRPERALEHAHQAERTYQQLMERAADEEQSDDLQTELGQLYNNWGYICRVKGEWNSALEYYFKALTFPGRSKNVARTLNNVGYVYFWQGDLVRARTHVGRALQIRQKLGIAYELGLGHNTMGFIMEQSGRMDEAADLYRKARFEFQAVNSERGEALVLLNLGRLNRVINNYEEALEYLEQARQVFERKRDKDQLIPVLNEIGCVYRQRGQNGDWEKAEKLLNESLELSKELGNLFAQADNWEDLSILHYRQAVEARRQGNEEDARYHAEEARKAARETEKLAERENYTYLLAKNERTFGDLAFLEEQYAQAFEHLFDACRLMARAVDEGKGSAVLMQRRYEQEVDRLQEQLQALPSPEQTRRQAKTLMEHLDGLEFGEGQALHALREYLNASIALAGYPTEGLSFFST